MVATRHDPPCLSSFVFSRVFRFFLFFSFGFFAVETEEMFRFSEISLVYSARLFGISSSNCITLLSYRIFSFPLYPIFILFKRNKFFRTFATDI